MSQNDFKPSPVASALAPSSPLAQLNAFNDRLKGLYHKLRQSASVFASPLGPFYHDDRLHHVPRFVYVDLDAPEEFLRLAFYGGLDSRDLRSTFALLHLVEELADTPKLASGLNLSVFPLADVSGLLRHKPQDLAGDSWRKPRHPELDLLSRDIRGRSYHGFIRIETSPAEDNLLTIRLRGQPTEAIGVDLISSEITDPWPVRWEAEPPNKVIHDGPLSLGDDLPHHPFELTISLPKTWSAAQHAEVTASILRRFILRHRTFQAYGRHL